MVRNEDKKKYQLGGPVSEQESRSKYQEYEKA